MEERLAPDDRLQRSVETSGMAVFLLGGIAAVVVIVKGFDASGPGLAIDGLRVLSGFLIGLWSWVLFMLTQTVGRILERIEELRPPEEAGSS